MLTGSCEKLLNLSRDLCAIVREITHAFERLGIDMKYFATIDVPDLDAGIAFYCLLGLEERFRPTDSYAVLGQGDLLLGLTAQAAGSQPTPNETTRRDYARHWTPVHLDFQVDDFEGILERLIAGGAVLEGQHGGDGKPGTAHLADPFGNGFCLLQSRG